MTRDGEVRHAGPPDTVEARAALLAIALESAREAARLVHAGWRKRLEVDHKGVVDLVTSYDRDSEHFLRTRLTEATPYPVVGEELGTLGSPGQATWYVDPLDGTTNFVHGHPFYCVSIGLLVGKTPVLGAVVAPALGAEWTGIVGGKAARNGAPCTVSGVTRFGDAMLATGFPYDRQTSPDNNFDAFVAMQKSAQAVRRCGSAAIDLCLVADGTYDGYWEKKLEAWDLAAGAAIVVAAGGTISSFDGSPADVTGGHLVATNGRIHEELLARLRAVASR